MSWLKERREELRFTQDEIAARLQTAGLDVPRSTYAAWESGRNPLPLMNAEFRRAIAKVLRWSESEVLRRSGFDLNQLHSREAQLAADIIDQLPPDKRSLALRVIEAVAAETG